MNRFHGTAASRATAGAITAALFLVFVYLLIIPMGRAVQAQVAKSVEQRESISQLAGLSEHGAQLRTVLGQLENRNAGTQMFLKSDKESTAAAEIEQLLKGIVSRRGGTIVSTQAMPEIQSDNARSVSVKIRLRGNLPELAMVLHNLESASTALFVKDLAIQTRNTVAPRSDQERSWRNLDVEFELVGYLSGASI